MIYVRVLFKESTHDRALSVWGCLLSADDDPWANLNVPDGYRLEMLDGEMVLVKDDSVAPKRKEIDCAHIVILNGLKDTYLYDNRVMTDSYAHWAYLAAEDDPVVTFAECVREDSR